MSKHVAEGGCLCGAIRYRVRGAPLSTTLCHCRSCRLACGGPTLAWAIFRMLREINEPQLQHTDWPLLGLALIGPLVMTLLGVVAALADPLRDAGVSIFAISTYDTDYVLVHEPDLATATRALRDAGHEVD